MEYSLKTVSRLTNFNLGKYFVDTHVTHKHILENQHKLHTYGHMLWKRLQEIFYPKWRKIRNYFFIIDFYVGIESIESHSQISSFPLYL